MAELHALRIKRIVVAVDASPTSRAAIRVAAELAASWNAELCGIFVEDADLLRWASLPFARAVNVLASTTDPVVRTELERQLRAQARQAHLELERAILHLPVRRSFRVTRGRVRDQLVESLPDAVLLSMGKGRPGHRLGSTARAMVAGARGHVLFTPAVARMPGPTAVVYDESPLAPEALAAAVEVAKGRPLTALCVADTAAGRQALVDRAEAALRGWGVEPHCVPLPASSAGDIHRAALHHGAQVLVLPAPSASLPVEAVVNAVSAFPGPVLVVGAGARSGEAPPGTD